MIDAIYYDGTSSRRHAVTVVIHQRVVAMRGEGLRRSARLSQLDVSERLQHAPRILRFADGGFIEADDHARLDAMLAENRYAAPRVVRWQNNWPWSLAALVCLLAILLSAYQWGLPLAADTLAQHLPPDIEKKIGDQSLQMMDRMLKPSRLAAADQDRLRARFMTLRQPRGEHTAYRIEFRSSAAGPNAFALPNGVIVMTDEMVQAAGNEEAIVGVLSHELGHLQRRHAARHVLQTVGVAVVLNLWIGDVSSALAAAPAILLAQKHSRDFEREADQYAIDMMLANGQPLEPLATLFESMASKHAFQVAAPVPPQASTNDDDEEDEESTPTNGPQAPRTPQPDYLSSHPSDAERIATLRAADRKRHN
jgi:Zn-dependent protease with chaperone function